MSCSVVSPVPVEAGKAMVQFRLSVGSWITVNRSLLKLTANDVGRAISVSSSTIRNWEQGIGNISMFHAICLRGYFTAEWGRFGRRHIVTPEEIAVREMPLPELSYQVVFTGVPGEVR
jgi:transcriptional regulator with XRE-family HTH domain